MAQNTCKDCLIILINCDGDVIHVSGLSIGENASVTLNLLSLGYENKKCYNEYFIIRHVFQTKEYFQGRQTYNSEVCIKGSTSNEFEVYYYEKLEEVIELQYFSQHNKVFLFKCYCYDTINRGIRVDPHHAIVTTSTMSLFLPSNASKFITHTLIHLEMIVQELIDYS